MTTELITTDDTEHFPPPAVARQSDNVATMLQMAIERGMDPGALEKIVGLYERVRANQAEREFNAALIAFQAECPIINRNKTADTGKYKYDYADLSHLVASIRPLLTQHGLSFSFDSAIVDGRVSVTCIVSHVGGHKVPTKFMAPTDVKSAMNDTQKVASAVSYCQRYALRLALGLTVGEDDDGRRAYDNPERNQQAPKAEPRGKRQPPPQTEVAPATLNDIKKAWVGWKGTGSKERDAQEFSAWAQQTSGREFNPLEIAQWKTADAVKCCNALSIPAPGEV